MAEKGLKSPAVSVLIPAFNAESSISSAIWSILNQSFTDFELLVYIDGATDKTVDMVAAIEDDRIQLILNAENKGIVHSRNELLIKAKGKYIAWLDSDDIALPGRLSAQFDFLESNPKIDFVGSWIEVRNADIKKVLQSNDSSFLETYLFFRNPFVQSSIMAKNMFVAENIFFDVAYEYCEDYELYLRCASMGKRFGLVKEFLCSYYQSSVSDEESKHRKYHFDDKIAKLFEKYSGPFQTDEEAHLILRFLRNSVPIPIKDANKIRKWLGRIKTARKKKGKLSMGTRAAFLYQRVRLARHSRGVIAAIWVLFKAGPTAVKFMLKHRPKYSK
jgi:glycosyltransferase involved in cell wall biosynthesis